VQKIYPEYDDETRDRVRNIINQQSNNAVNMNGKKMMAGRQDYQSSGATELVGGRGGMQHQRVPNGGVGSQDFGRSGGLDRLIGSP